MLTVGGGSGGHVTPILAIISELKRSQKDNLEIRFWSDRRFATQAKQIIQHDNSDIKTKAIFSGKLRRYHNTSWWRQLLDLPTLIKNIGDMFLLFLGCAQSFFLLIAWRPDVIFTKGGFVCLPVGIAAHLLRIPLVIHDSDAHPGLTNRILAPWARAIATGAPLEHYSYPKSKAKYVGIPIKSDFHAFSPDEQRRAKEALGILADKPLVVITGGGLGAERINKAAVAIANKLLSYASVIHVAGAKQFEQFEDKVPQDPNYTLLPFVSQGMAQLLGAADVVVTRAGATTMLELAALQKAVIVVPNAMLTGGHQLKNAKVYEKENAVIVADELQFQDDPSVLFEEIMLLINDNDLRQKMGKRLGKFAKPNAARDTVELIIKTAKKETQDGLVG